MSESELGWEAYVRRRLEAHQAEIDHDKKYLGEDEFNRREAVKAQTVDWLWSRMEPLVAQAIEIGFNLFDCRLLLGKRDNLAISFKFSNGKGSHYVIKGTSYKKILEKGGCDALAGNALEIKKRIQARVFSVPEITANEWPQGKRIRRPALKPGG